MWTEINQNHSKSKWDVYIFPLMIHSNSLILLVFNSVLIRRYWGTLFWKSNFVTTLYFWNIISITIEVEPFLLIQIFQARVCHVRGIPFPVQPWLTTVSPQRTFKHSRCGCFLNTTTGNQFCSVEVYVRLPVRLALIRLLPEKILRILVL